MAGNSYYYRKLHSLLGVVPIGLFLIEHLLTNYSAFEGGKEQFLDRVHWLNDLPFVLLLEIFFIGLPILYHGVYGIYVAFQSRNNVSQYGYARNYRFMLQRVTGIITLVFIVWHVYETRVQVALGNITHDELASTMHDIASNPVYLTFYIIAIISAVFHFCNGMWSFLVSWGITVGPRAQRISSYVWMTAFVLISIVGILAITAFIDDSFAMNGSAVWHIG